MKRFALLCVFLSPLAFAAEPIDGLYAEIFGGYSYLPNNLNTTLNQLSWTEARYISGYNVGGRYGYKSNPMRYELEVGYISASANRFNVNNILQTGISGQTNATDALINVYYDGHEFVRTIVPFIGGGIGYAYVSSHLYGSGPSMETEFRGTDSVLAYQGTVGLAYNFVDNYALSIAYRYFGTTKADQLGEAFQAHLASAGVTYRFDGGYYK